MREFVTGQNLGRWREFEPQLALAVSNGKFQTCVASPRWFKALAKFPFAILASALLSQTTKYVQAPKSKNQTYLR